MQQQKIVKSQPKSRVKHVKMRGKNGFKYIPKWAVIIPCDDEQSQQSTYEFIKRNGYACRVVNV